MAFIGKLRSGFNLIYGKIVPARFRLRILPGSRYAEYATPIDHAPAMDYRQRWGFPAPR